MAAHPHIKVTAATDIRPEALDRFASKFGWETYLSVEGLCRSRDVDIVRTIGGGLVSAWTNDAPLTFNDGGWGRATLEACLAIRDSSRQGREPQMTRQVPYSG